MSTKSKVVVAGGSGFLGVSLAYHLMERGYEVVIVSRKPPKAKGNWQWTAWDGRTLGDWKMQLEDASAVVNLTGRTVDCRKTPDHQDEIIRSRVESVNVIGRALRACKKAPPVWVQMSTAHLYGDPPSVVCDESSAAGIGLAPTVAKAWEAALAENVLPDQRWVVVRTSFVIGRDRGCGNGALARLVPLARWGLGGRVGGGKQGMSWIHEVDMNRILTRAVEEPTMQGAYIASSPHPVSQVEFMRALRRAVGMPIGLPATEWMVRLGARWLLNTDPDLALYGRYVVPRRLLDEGFTFEYPELPPALNHLLK